jgi:hypothetical protein
MSMVRGRQPAEAAGFPPAYDDTPRSQRPLPLRKICPGSIFFCRRNIFPFPAGHLFAHFSKNSFTGWGYPQYPQIIVDYFGPTIFHGEMGGFTKKSCPTPGRTKPRRSAWAERLGASPRAALRLGRERRILRPFGSGARADAPRGLSIGHRTKVSGSRRRRKV